MTAPAPEPVVVDSSRTYDDSDIKNLADHISDTIEALWLALRNGLEDLADFWIGVLYAVITFGMDALGGLMLVAVSILPSVPDMPSGGAFGLIASANTFVPVEESFVALGFLASVYSARGLYLLARFIRGGG
ncbi:hypothetical protein [Deinococcus sp. SL84]|uniref:hypothetical protein n=1 Tax=Deinococcus sp. SL84 TaxID=2994663 RepID=UPI00227500EF|nr:hypothetical protein [Deinococcus sp. SL84]MCY1703443.1 hypothetical protein [Deinococcus sp. SL84]